jgi:hypothetical protein
MINVHGGTWKDYYRDMIDNPETQHASWNMTGKKGWIVVVPDYRLCNSQVSEHSRSAAISLSCFGLSRDILATILHGNAEAGDAIGGGRWIGSHLSVASPGKRAFWGIFQTNLSGTPFLMGRYA